MSWTFITNHGVVLLCLAEDPDMRLVDVAERVGVTERAVQAMVADLEEAGYLERERRGRRNHYRIRTDQPLRHDQTAHRQVGELLELLQRR